MYGAVTTINSVGGRIEKTIESIADQFCPKCNWKRFSNPQRKSGPGIVACAKSSVQDTNRFRSGKI